MLVGRSAECELLRRLIAGGREESAGVILLRGEPGIGKTSLLTFAVGAADGFRVLQIQGHESEIGIPFAGLSWLLESLTGLLGQLPPVQAEALAGALQLGPAAGRDGDRLAVAAATLTLLAAAADAQPLLVAVDDGQWLDVPSLEAIVFAARRLQAEAIAVVITARPAVDVPAEVNRLLEALPEHKVPGLAPDAARELLAAQQAGLAPEVLAGRIAEAAGNPLALLELPAPGDGGLPVEPLRIGKRLEQAFGQRIAAMPPPTRQAMLLVAAADAAASDVLSRALAQDGLSAADLEPAETAGLLVSERGAVRFQHPLVRSALCQSVTATQRRPAGPRQGPRSCGPSRGGLQGAAGTSPAGSSCPVRARTPDAPPRPAGRRRPSRRIPTRPLPGRPILPVHQPSSAPACLMPAWRGGGKRAG